MRELSPTLVRTAEITGLATATGATAEMDFDFGLQEGARLIGVYYRWDWTAGTHVGIDGGIYLGPTRSNPTAIDELAIDEDVVADFSFYIQQEAAGEQHHWSAMVDLSHMDLYITRNIRFCVYNVSATNINNAIAKVYYNRIQFSAEEAVVQMTIRR